MSRSLKKGPYINVSLEKKILAMNESDPISWDTLLQFITVTNLSLFTLQKTWLVTSSESLHLHVVSVVTPVTRSNPREN